eukprot:12258297-Heterocapsa_arctica.AAC.2
MRRSLERHRLAHKGRMNASSARLVWTVGNIMTTRVMCPSLSIIRYSRRSGIGMLSSKDIHPSIRIALPTLFIRGKIAIGELALTRAPRMNGGVKRGNLGSITRGGRTSRGSMLRLARSTSK